MFKFSFLSASAAALFALSSLSADDAAAQPAASSAPSRTADSVQSSQPASFGEPAPDPASTVNETEEAPKKEGKKKTVYKSSKLVSYLIITSNYATPLFLAETAQKKAGCPVVVVPEALPFPEKGTLLTVRLPDNDTLMIRAEDLSRFLAYLRPRNVIILGNNDVVPPIYSLAVPSGTSLIRVDDRAWKVNAIRLDDLLNTSPSIYHAYRTYNKQRMIQAEQAARERGAKPETEAASGK